MDIEVKKEKQYAALDIKVETVTKALCEELKNTISTYMEKGTKNFIVNLKAVKDAGADLYVSLDTIMNMLLKEEGMMVVTGCKGEIKTFIENKGIITTRSMDEAVDYVFMEEIEKQLQSGANDDDLDDF